jgi:glycosyltransferase involved in cell wall biosynthesis
MIDAAAELRKRGAAVWFVVPEPRSPFASGADRPTIASLIGELPREQRPSLVTPSVGSRFELGTHGYRTAVYSKAVAASVPAGTPVIVSDDPDVWAAAARISGTYPMIGVLHADEPKYYALARTYGSHLASCVAVSHRIARIASGDTGLTVDTIPCGVPIRTDPSAATPTDGMARLVWIGRMEEEQKRVSDLPRIASALRDRGLSFTFHLIGDGPQRATLEHDIRERGLENEIRLTGWLDTQRIWTELRESDVLVLPSNFEGMPVVVMEALSAGCAIVASRVSGVEDAAQDPRASGVVFTHDIGDTDAAASQIARAVALPRDVRRAMARAAATQLFAIEVCVDRYLEVLNRARSAGHSARDGAPQPPLLALRAFLGGAVSLPLALARSGRRALLGTVPR